MSSDHTTVIRKVRMWSLLGGLAAMALWAASAAAQPSATPAPQDPRNKPPLADIAAEVLIDALQPGNAAREADLVRIAVDKEIAAHADINQQVQQARAEVQKLRAELDAARLRVAELERTLAQQKKAVVGFAPTPPTDVFRPVPESNGPVSVYITPGKVAVGTASGEIYGLGVPTEPNAVVITRDGKNVIARSVTTAAISREQRLEALERQVQAMLDEVKSLRNEIQGAAPKSGAGTGQNNFNPQLWGQPRK